MNQPQNRVRNALARRNCPLFKKKLIWLLYLHGCEHCLSRDHYCCCCHCCRCCYFHIPLFHSFLNNFRSVFYCTSWYDHIIRGMCCLWVKAARSPTHNTSPRCVAEKWLAPSVIAFQLGYIYSLLNAHTYEWSMWHLYQAVVKQYPKNWIKLHFGRKLIQNGGALTEAKMCD